MDKHSDKALETLRQMGTTATDWTLTPIKWVEEMRTVMGRVECPDCRGGKYTRYDAAGALIPMPPKAPVDAYHFDPANVALREYVALARKEGGGLYGTCRRCVGTRGRMQGYPTGTIPGMVQRLVMVGYPQFPAGTKFDSRFNAGCNCNLCNKLVLKSGMVPVHATVDGKTHGMYVGEDCARKFLSVKIKREPDSIMEGATA